MSDEMLPARGVDVPRREKFRISDLGVVRWIFYFRDARVRVVGTQRVLFLPLKQSPGKLTQEGEVWCRGRQPGQCGGAGERYRCCQLRLVRYMRVCVDPLRAVLCGGLRPLRLVLGGPIPGASREGSTGGQRGWLVAAVPSLSAFPCTHFHGAEAIVDRSATSDTAAKLPP